MSTSPAASNETVVVSTNQNILNVNMTNVTKLTASNFLMWSLQVHALLDGYDLAGFLDGSTVIPTSTITTNGVTTANPEYTLWKRQDKLIYSALFGAITVSIQPILSTTTTSAQIWSTLSATYAKPSFTTRFDQLALLGKAIDIEDQIEYVLEGLPEEYHQVVDQIEGRETIPSLTEVHEKLLNFEVKLQSKAITPTNLPITAHAATARGSSNNNNNQRNNYHGQARNNSRGNQTWQQQGLSRNDPNAPRGYQGRCQICGVQGHSAKRCPQLPFSSPAYNNNTRHNNSPVSWQPRANMAVTQAYNPNNWVLDTGATHHLTSDLDNLSLHQPYTGADEVTLADGSSIAISHTGSTILPTPSRPLALNDILCVPNVHKKLVSVYRMCNTNNVSVEFFHAHFQSHVKETFVAFKALVENRFQHKIRNLYSDNGGEFIALRSFLSAHGISHLTSPPHTPEHNGISERKHRHIVETGLTLLHQASIPTTYWTYAFATAVYLINRLPTPVIAHQSPYFKLFQQQPNYLKLRVFGSLCFPWLRPYTSHKLDNRSMPCTFLEPISLSGHSPPTLIPVPPPSLVQPSSAAPPSSDPSPTASLTPSTSVSVASAQNLEMGSTNNSSGPSVPSPTQAHTETTSSPNPSPNPQPNSSQSTNSASSSPPTPTPQPTPTPPQTPTPPPPPENRHNMTTRAKNNITKPTQRLTLLTKAKTPKPLIPSTINQAMRDPNWTNAMGDEYNAQLRNRTFDLVPPAPNQNIVPTMWIYTLKYLPNGFLDRYKARWVARGFNQQYGLDYAETFSPVVKSLTIRLVLQLAVNNNWQVKQLDVNNAFLHGTLTEEVYVSQPPGFVDRDKPDHVCRLNKALYGLKQAPRAWYQELKSYLCRMGCINSVADTSVFAYISGDQVVYALVYVDDIIVTGSSLSLVSAFINALGAQFSLNDPVDLTYFLGIEVTRTTTGMHLMQRKYIIDLLTKVNMLDAKPVATPMTPHPKLSLQSGHPIDNPTEFRTVVGSLQYLAFTRPDIAYSVNRLSQFMHRPTDLHWQAAKRILRYLAGTLSHGILLKPNTPLHLHAYSDADWAGDTDDFVSTNAYILYLGSTPICWSSKKQKGVARSSTEAEYRSVANTAAEIRWVCSLLTELGVQLPSTPVIYCDNVGATYLSANPVFHSRMKHLALDFHFVRENVQSGALRVAFVSTKDQLADALTKPLPRPRFLDLMSKIGVRELPPS
ncbi:unnamed protein product [Microthlaspi erraticum]|uniref:Integrase catalytic domain-containing protein n=1 Tax=Microthlaspi erraticum TaxID=1685480 RepID=A0A6D2KYY2_9BRAS|nr:unnamed protein product [Microthlaspi erraticum]